MRFKSYYDLTRKETRIFEEIFDQYYTKGYFGNINKEEIKIQQKIWFSKFKSFMIDKNIDELIRALANKENKLSREWFTQLTGYNIKYETKEKVLAFVKDYINKTKAELKLIGMIK